MFAEALGANRWQLAVPSLMSSSRKSSSEVMRSIQLRIERKSDVSQSNAPLPATSVHRSDIASDDRKSHHLRFQNGHAKPFRVEAKSKKSLVAYASCISASVSLDWAEYSISQLLQHAMICVRRLSNDAKMNISDLCSASACLRKVFVLWQLRCARHGFGLLGSAIRG